MRRIPAAMFGVARSVQAVYDLTARHYHRSKAEELAADMAKLKRGRK